jgi:hypothetical protein
MGLGVERLELLVGELELCAQELDRILRVAKLLDLLLRPVDLGVADVVADETVGADVEEDGTLARDGVLARLTRRGVDLLDVLAVDLMECIRRQPRAARSPGSANAARSASIPPSRSSRARRAPAPSTAGRG